MKVIPAETVFVQPGKLVLVVRKLLRVRQWETIVFSAACFAMFVLSVHGIAANKCSHTAFKSRFEILRTLG